MSKDQMDTILQHNDRNFPELLVGVFNYKMPRVTGEENFLDKTFEYKLSLK